MPIPFDTASTTYLPPPFHPRPLLFPPLRPLTCSCASNGRIIPHTLHIAKSPHSLIILTSSLISPPLPFIWDLSYCSTLSTPTVSQFSQGLVGSVSDTDWESPVPQAASIEGLGKGTYTALVGFPFGSGLDFILEIHFPSSPLIAVNV